MSLDKAVEVIAEEMEKVTKESKGDGSVPMWEVLSWAKQLRIALKVAEATPTQPVHRPDPEAFHREQIEKAKAEFRKNKEEGLETVYKDTVMLKATNAEEGSPTLYEVLDGPSTGDHIPLPGDMPIWANTRIGDSIYQLGSDRKLRYQRPFVQV